MRHLRSSCKNATSNLELWCLLTTYRSYVSLTGLFKEPIIGSLQSKMAEIRHLENRHDIIFFCRGWSDLDKILQNGTEWHVDCGDVWKWKPLCRIPIWRTFGRIQWHVIPQLCVTLQGAATWWIHCHDSIATCHMTEINVVIVPHCRV